MAGPLPQQNEKQSASQNIAGRLSLTDKSVLIFRLPAQELGVQRNV
jgi:hypothetical protein